MGVGKAIKFSAWQIQILMHSFALNHTLPEHDANKWAKLSRNLFGMVQQITNLISNLIGNVSFIYESLGIDFDLTNMHHTLLRLLTPFQLLSYFRLDDTSRYFTDRLFRKSGIQPEEGPLPQPINKTKVDIKYDKYDRELTKILRGEIKFDSIPEQKKVAQLQIEKNAVKKEQLNNSTPPALPHNADNKQPVPDKDEWKFVEVRRQGMKPILGTEGERKLCQWTYEKLKKDEKILLKDIAKQAKVIGKNIRGFGASISWVHRFFDRYPDLYELYKQARKEQNECKGEKGEKLGEELAKDEQGEEKKWDKAGGGRCEQKANESNKNLIYNEQQDNFEEMVYPKSKPKQSAKSRSIPICQPLIGENLD